jgi:hypothetical protein
LKKKTAEGTSMQISHLQSVFQPEELEKLDAAYKAALLEIRGRPEWRRTLGPDETRAIIASTILACARTGRSGEVALTDLAVAAVQERFQTLTFSSEMAADVMPTDTHYEAT